MIRTLRYYVRARDWVALAAVGTGLTFGAVSLVALVAVVGLTVTR